jgi:lipoate-protein ligase A
MPREWRLIRDAAAPGAWNMGVDEALLATAIRDGLPTLRFYRWEGFWLSLGRGQRLDPLRADACRTSGVGLVQRSTGGKAVLHGADLTYALAAPEVALPTGLAATYQTVNDALGTALASLGVAVDARCKSFRTPGREVFDCFAHPAAHELVARGRKLAGSAQRRAQGGVLQHGSIRLESEPTPVREAAGLAPGTATSLQELGYEGSLEALLEAITAALGSSLEACFEAGALDPAERQAARARKSFSP